MLSTIFNDWKLSGVLTIGSGRPVDVKVFGDPNQDGNSSNDRPAMVATRSWGPTTPPRTFD